MAALAAAIVALALVATACSSGGSSGGSEATGDAKATTTAPKDAASGPGTPLPRYASYETTSYDDPSHWVCRPDQDDICDEPLDATRIDADGTTTVEPFEKAKDPAFDCFYVYPTISRDPGLNSDWQASDDEEGWVTLNQAGRLQSECRLFAPVYRQITLAGLAGAMSGDGKQFSREELDRFRAMPYDDVLDAWKTYMAEDNGGRPVLLIGHSQGSGMLNQLIAKEIDPHADVRKLLVGAYLAGGSVAVPEGEVVGGDFKHVPLCTADGQAGCVATWATFRSTAPPPANSFFGRPRGAAKGEVAGCVSPAAFDGSAADLDAYFPTTRGATMMSRGGDAKGKQTEWLDAAAGTVTTPFVHLPDLVRGECTSKDGFAYLEATVQPSQGPRADDIPGDLTPEWGLHLVDVNLTMGDIVRQARDQAAALQAGD